MGPLRSSRVPFGLHGSPSLFKGPLRSSRDPSDKSICVSKPSTQLLSHVTMYYDFLPMYYEFCPMYYDFCHSTWSSGFIATRILITIWVAMSIYCGFSHSTLACYAHVKYMYCDKGDIYCDSICTMILCMYCDSRAISACHAHVLSYVIVDVLLHRDHVL